MSEPTLQNTSRREFLKSTGRIAASSALAAGITSRMYAGQSNTIKVVLVGCDAYKKAMDCLSPGDVAIFATPPAFRWVHFTYAIKKGLNVFMEKPVTVDGPTTKRMIELAKEAAKKNLKW